jgi:hypothetical protein
MSAGAVVCLLPSDLVSAKIPTSQRRDVGHPGSAGRSMLDSLQVFAGVGVGMRERERGAIFFGGGALVALFFE